MENEASFAGFYASEYRKVFACAYSWAGDRDIAFDATQEAFSRALARWGRLSSHSWAAGWVVTTAINQCRRNRSITRRELGGIAADANPADAVDGLRLDLVRALARVPARQRRAAILHYVADYPVLVVAELMGISEGGVKAHLAKARERLRAELGEAYDMTDEREVPE